MSSDEPPDAQIDFLTRYGGGNSSSDYMFVTPNGDGVVIDVDGFRYASYRIEQFAQRVIDYSSQYGSDYSISYTATNITGKPTQFPDYGDFPETFAMRTYGDWWQKAPSYSPEIQPQNQPKIPVQDFIVIHYEDYIIPDEITIFETFNPGAVIRIWAYTIAKSWYCLWESDEFYTNPPYNLRARKFSPPLRKIQLPTKILRLEFNHMHLKYFTEIDAVLFCGHSVNVKHMQRILECHERQKKGSILHKLQRIKFRPSFKENYQSRLQHFLAHDLDKFMAGLSTTNTTGNELSSDEGVKKAPKILTDLPFEIVLHIFSYLDLISVFRVGQVCRFLHDVSLHPLLYSEINLKPYWHLASTDLLCTLAKRSTILKKLDLSWCGLHNSICSTEFKKFIQQRGDTLTHLRLNSCSFLRAACIQTVGIVCDNLKELSLRNYVNDSPVLFSSLANLKNLERLDLFKTVTEPDLLLTMLEANRKLKHINLAFCGVAVSMDEVAQHIGIYNQQLISLDMWKSHFLTATGLRALCNCHDLEEVDFGWCLREASLGDSMRQLISACPKLKKLFLATVRGITERDVSHIANTCSNLEQLDLMGVIGISKERYYEILLKCKNLQLLDLCFCDNIDEKQIQNWSRIFNVSIKCSPTPVNSVQ